MLRVETVARPATGPDGQPGELLDGGAGSGGWGTRLSALDPGRGSVGALDEGVDGGRGEHRRGNTGGGNTAGVNTALLWSQR